MSKPVLGRGLSSLLGVRDESVRGEGASAENPAGVQLLLRGTDGSELVPEVPVRDEEQAPLFPRWALAGAVVTDGLLMAVALWVVMARGDWGRYVAAATLLLAGAGVLSAAVWLRGQPALRELQSLNPLAEEKPRLRVQFMDEAPRRRD